VPVGNLIRSEFYGIGLANYACNSLRRLPLPGLLIRRIPARKISYMPKMQIAGSQVCHIAGWRPDLSAYALSPAATIKYISMIKAKIS
jgi:hypothetical protein